MLCFRSGLLLGLPGDGQLVGYLGHMKATMCREEAGGGCLKHVSPSLMNQALALRWATPCLTVRESKQRVQMLALAGCWSHHETRVLEQAMVQVGDPMKVKTIGLL